MRTNMISRNIATGLLVAALGAGCLSARPPKKRPFTSYTSLWTNSPFTVKPEPTPDEPVADALEDYVLTGVSKLPEGYFVVLMNKKERDKRIRIAPNEQNAEGFKVVNVKQDPYDYMKTVVEIAVGGGKTGVVTYEEKFLALKTPAPQRKPATPARQALPPGVKPPTNNTRTATPPRVRRVPTPPKR